MIAERNLTVLDALIAALRASAAFDKNDQVPPSVILWTDEERTWTELLPKLRAAMPELITFGAYDPATKSGPAIWIKAAIARATDGSPLVAGADWPVGAVPVIYLPGVSRQTLRNVEDATPELRPICELQYRGTLWTQISGKDWTPRAFLQSADGGLNLSLGGDAATLGAMRQALVTLADVPVARLQGRTLDAGDFHELLAPDPSRTVLDWLSDAPAFKARSAAAWPAFRTICKDKFGFDPDKTDVTKAGELLSHRQGAWAGVWSRFEESPRLYPGIREVLRRSKPSGADSLFGTGPSIYPQDNEAAELELRTDLIKVGGMNEAAARSRLLTLETTHAPRREVVWAKLGESPLAAAMVHLAELARFSSKSLGGGNRDEAAALYAEWGWRVDDAAMNTLAAAQSAADLAAVGAAVAAVYRPWLEKAATSFQKLVTDSPLASAAEAPVVAAEAGTCILFADGLRMDLGQRLGAELGKRGVGVAVGWRWSAVPTVTATAKPAASPVAARVSPTSTSDEFVPQISESKKNITSDRFRSLLKAMEIDVLGAGEKGNPARAAWMEVGTIDHRGHGEGVRLASMLDEEIRLIADRVMDLVSEGWAKIKIVTDHGWLLLPGGLPKVTLPKFLVETNWRRCASVKEGASPECQQHGWHWNPLISIALAPGIACFREGAEYAHGGLSLQECVTPVLTINVGGSPRGDAAIESLTWTQLRARVHVVGKGAVAVDLRREAADGTSTLSESGGPRPLDEKGQATIYAKDDADGQAAELVLLDGNGNVLARRTTRIGME